MLKSKLVILSLAFLLTFGFFSFTAVANTSFGLASIDNEEENEPWSYDDFENVEPMPMPVPSPIVVPPPGTYSDNQEENDELEEPVGSGLDEVEPLPFPSPIIVPPPGTYSDNNQEENQEENDELEEPSEGEGFVEGGSIINPEDLPVEETSGDGNIEAPRPGTPPSDNTDNEGGRPTVERD